MKNNPLIALQQYGQSIWLDYLNRQMIDSGELARLIEEDGLRGVTTNPAIFQQVIGESDIYNNDLERLARAGKNAEEIYQSLVVEDVQRAADLFRPLYDSSQGLHGFVSLEVSPHLAYDSNRTIEEARHYWQLLARPNVFIKVPATKAGLPAITQLISEGINVNITLLFGLPRYRKVALAYLDGLTQRLALGEAAKRVSSVASFFLSRIDVMVDELLLQKKEAGGPQAHTSSALLGQVAIASAKRAYQIYEELFGTTSFQKMIEKDQARPQRLLWASTSNKNPDYLDTKYVEPLIGPETINTLPPATLNAYREHGQPAARLKHDMDRAGEVLQDLADLGIDLDRLTQLLEDEGLKKFQQPFDLLMESIEQRRRSFIG
jgi:transaldolase